MGAAAASTWRPVRFGRPVIPVWIPACEVELLARRASGSDRGSVTVPAGAAVEGPVRLLVK